jgi:hypothetical protein
MYPVRVPRTSACFSIVIFATQCLRSSSPSCQQARSARLSHACLKTCPSKTVFVYSPLTRVNLSNSHDTTRYSVTSLNGTVFPAMQAPPHSPDYDTGRDLPATINALLTALKQKGEPPLAYVGWLTVTDMLASVLWLTD